MSCVGAAFFGYKPRIKKTPLVPPFERVAIIKENYALDGYIFFNFSRTANEPLHPLCTLSEQFETGSGDIGARTIWCVNKG